MKCRGKGYCQKIYMTQVIQRQLNVVRVMTPTVEGRVKYGNVEAVYHIEDSSAEIY